MMAEAKEPIVSKSMKKEMLRITEEPDTDKGFCAKVS